MAYASTQSSPLNTLGPMTAEAPAHGEVLTLPLTPDMRALIAADNTGQLKAEVFTFVVWSGACLWGFLTHGGIRFTIALIVLGFLGVIAYDIWRRQRRHQRLRQGTFERYVGPLTITYTAPAQSDAQNNRYVIGMGTTRRVVDLPSGLYLPTDVTRGSVDYFGAFVLAIRDADDHTVYPDWRL